MSVIGFRKCWLAMAFINKVTAEPSGNNLNGIIYSLKNKFNIANPIDDGIIVPSGTTTESRSSNIENTIVGWSESCWATVNTDPNPFYQIYFPKHWLLVSGYSLRGCSLWSYPKKWKVFGFNEENKNNESKWDELGENSSTSSQPFCYTTSTYCDTNFAVGTFTTKITNKFYQYIRFVSTQSSYTNNPRFILSGFDIFGTLSLTKSNALPRRTICTCLRKPRIVSSDVIVLIIGMSILQS